MPNVAETPTNTQASQESKAMLKRWMLQLAEGSIDQKTEAFDNIWPTANRVVMKIALSILRNHDEAEDVRQETMKTIWEKAYRYEGKGDPEPWFHTIAFRCAVKKVTRDLHRKLSTPLEGAFDPYNPEGTERNSHPQAEQDEFDNLVEPGEVEIWEVVSRVLDTLPEEEARAVFFRLGSKYNLRTIAKLTRRRGSISNTILRSGLMKVQEALRRELGLERRNQLQGQSGQE